MPHIYGWHKHPYFNMNIVIDVASNTVETLEEVTDTLRKALRFVDADKLYPSPTVAWRPCPDK